MINPKAIIPFAKSRWSREFLAIKKKSSGISNPSYNNPKEYIFNNRLVINIAVQLEQSEYFGPMYALQDVLMNHGCDYFNQFDLGDIVMTHDLCEYIWICIDKKGSMGSAYSLLNEMVNQGCKKIWNTNAQMILYFYKESRKNHIQRYGYGWHKVWMADSD